jgi:hypothetical protein
MATEKKSSKVRAHQRYKLADGTIVPGATTVTGLRAKPFLVPWANKLGLQGIDSSKYVDEKADIGTLAHLMINKHLSKEPLDTSEFSQFVIDQAGNCFNKFLDWEKKHTLEPIFLERELVSESEKFGGCVDYYGKVDGLLELLDFKTAKAIFDEMYYQLAGYEILLEDNFLAVENKRILRIGRTEDEGFEEKERRDLTLQKVIFRSLLTIYNTEKLLKKE